MFESMLKLIFYFLRNRQMGITKMDSGQNGYFIRIVEVWKIEIISVLFYPCGYNLVEIRFKMDKW